MRSIPVLSEATIQSFRKQALENARPSRFPQGLFKNRANERAFIPATAKWFRSNDQKREKSLNLAYLSKYEAFNVPVEVTTVTSEAPMQARRDGSQDHFAITDMPFKDFMNLTQELDSAHRIYLAQCSLNSLPNELKGDLPTPEFVTKAGRGDVYDSSIWIGKSPTYTPLHKDPNPNLFVQMAGQKVVRMFEPPVGDGIFREVQHRLRATSSASFRGEEMMHGQERSMLENLVWNNVESQIGEQAYEAVLDSGDGLFIPRGWWHSIKSHGCGINGSVCLCMVSNTPFINYI